MSTQDTLLVTGVSGNLARQTVEFLVKNGATKVIGTTRKPEKAEALKNLGVTIRPANFDDPSTLVEAFRGANRMLLISTNKIGQRVPQHKNAIDAAKAAGVKQVIYTSLASADSYSGVITNEHVETENYLKQSGLNYLILRNNLYMDTLPMKLKAAIQWGSFMGCSGEGKASYISREDCARAAAAALIQTKITNTTIDISGPKALSGNDVAQITSQVVGKPVSYKDTTTDEFKATLGKMGMPPVFADGIAGFDVMAKQNLLATSGSAVRELIGREPESLEAFLNRNKAALQ